MEWELVVASGNRGKLVEIGATLALPGLRLLPVGDLVPGFDVEETGETFLDNSRLKARAAYAATGRASVADDSGLCVVGLGLEPGVRSSRYAGDNRTDVERNAFLLEKMRSLTEDARRAWFACVVYAIIPRRKIRPWADCLLEELPGVEPGYVGISVEGRLSGTIGPAPCGCEGFGYDPVFVPDADASRTLAEFSLAEKNAISHRGQAFGKLRECLGA